MSLTTGQRKALQRKRDKAAGWKEVSLKINPAYEAELKAFAASLPPPDPPKDPKQIDLIDYIEKQISGEVAYDPNGANLEKPEEASQGSLF